MKSPASRAAGGADRLTEHGVDNIDIAGCEDPAEVVIVGQVSTLMPGPAHLYVTAEPRGCWIVTRRSRVWAAPSLSLYARFGSERRSLISGGSRSLRNSSITRFQMSLTVALSQEAVPQDRLCSEAMSTDERP